MEKGHLPYNTYVRCTDKTLRTSAGGITRARRQGAPSFIDINGGMLCVCSVGVSYLDEKYVRMCFFRAINELRANGSKLKLLMFSAAFPKDTEEKLIRRFMGLMDGLCENAGMVLVPGNLEISEAVTSPYINLIAFGEAKGETVIPKNGDGIICAGSISKGGMGVLLSSWEESLKKRFSEGFFSQAIEKTEVLDINDIIRIIGEIDYYAQPVAEGGILAALWELKSSFDIGFEADLRMVPVHQELVELSEYLAVNPYRLSGDGAVLIVSEKYQDILDRLECAGIKASLIGTVTKGPAGNIKKDDEISCISRPEPDEIFRILGQ